MMRHEFLNAVTTVSLITGIGGLAASSYYNATSHAHHKDAVIVSGDLAYTEQSLAPEIDRLAGEDQRKASFANFVLLSSIGSAAAASAARKRRPRP